jgi:hypothetical protein
MRIISILGSQRSGTTLMGQVLGASPQAVIIDEEDGLYPWIEPALLDKGPVLAGAEFERVYRAARRKYAQPADRFREDGALRAKVTDLVLKAPNLTYYYPQFDRLGLTGPHVFLFRDIRDVAASILNLNRTPIVRNQLNRLESHDWLPDRLRNLAVELRKESVPDCLKAALVAQAKMQLADEFERLGVELVRIRYEDLVTRPAETHRLLAGALGWPPLPSSQQSQRIFSGSGPGGMQRSHPLHSQSIGRWRSVLTADEEALIWRHVGGYMESLGYERDSKSDDDPHT